MTTISNKKKQFTLFQVFTGENAKGNAAAVMLVDILPSLREHQTLKSPATTAIYIQRLQGNKVAIRWFNSHQQIQRCGHGTLAAAYFLHQITIDSFNSGPVDSNNTIEFISETETITAIKTHTGFALKLPIEKIESCSINTLPFTCNTSAQTPREDGYLIVEMESASAVREFILSTAVIAAIKQRALIITAKNEQPNSGIIFRYFAPQYGLVEDSATGSAASILWPFWAVKKHSPITNRATTKAILHCYQTSPEGGELHVTESQNEILVDGQIKHSETQYLPDQITSK